MNKPDVRYRFIVNDDGSIGPGKEIAINDVICTGDEIIVKIGQIASESYMVKHCALRSEWEIDLSRTDSAGVEFFIWDYDSEGHRVLPMDDFFSWLLEKSPAEHNFIMFNMEFFNNEFTLV